MKRGPRLRRTPLPTPPGPLAEGATGFLSISGPLCPDCNSTPHAPDCLYRHLPYTTLRKLSQEPVTDAWPSYPSVHCTCFTPARHHPSTKRVVGCPRCQTATTAIAFSFGPLRCRFCGCPDYKHHPHGNSGPGQSHYCDGCGGIHTLQVPDPLPPLAAPGTETK